MEICCMQRRHMMDPDVDKQKMFTTLQEQFMWNVDKRGSVSSPLVLQGS